MPQHKITFEEKTDKRRVLPFLQNVRTFSEISFKANISGLKYMVFFTIFTTFTEVWVDGTPHYYNGGQFFILSSYPH